MKQFPISSVSAIFCSKSKDKVLVAVNLFMRFFCKSAKEKFTENQYITKILKKKNNFFIKLGL